MNTIKKLLILQVCLAAIWSIFPIQAYAIDPQYIFIRKSPMHCVPDCSYLWNFDIPGNFNATAINDVLNLVGTRGTEQRKLGIGVELNYNHVYDFNRVKTSLQNLLTSTQTASVPVFINLSGFQWWGDVNLGWNGRPDLWNWWDPAKSGYNPENKNNVEWTNWNNSSATKKAWRNWGGGDFEVRPHPNLASRAFIDSSKTRLAELVPIIVDWYTALPADKKWLLGGVSNGTENDIGINYHVYANNDIPLNNLGQSLQLGYAAVKTAGIRSSGGPPTVEELNEVIRRYQNELDEFIYDKGIPRSKIFNHTGASDIFPGTLPPGLTFPTTAGALTPYGSPGWSFYGDVNRNPQNYSGLSFALDPITGVNHSEWASPEWDPMILHDANEYQNWVNSLQNTLNFRNNRSVNISNWENTVRPYTEVLHAIQTVLNESPSCWITAPQMETITNSGGNVTLTWQKGNYDHAYLRISTTGNFGIDGILTLTGGSVDYVKYGAIDITTITKTGLNPGKYYWQFTADGCVTAQYYFQNRTSDGSFMVGSLPGDANADGVVNTADYTIWANHYQQAQSGQENGDFNQDNQVNGIDYTIWLNNFAE